MEQAGEREELAVILTKQDKNCRLLQLLVHEVRGLQERVTELEPQTFLPAIESPPNPNNFVNVSRFLREVIHNRNATIPIGGRKYFAFPEDLSDHQLNMDALMCIEGLLCLHMSDHYGKRTWQEVYERDRVRCERFIQNAKHVPELAVFAQTAAQWAIRKLVESKMKSRLRTEKARTARQAARRERQENTHHQESGIQTGQNQPFIAVENQDIHSRTLHADRSGEPNPPHPTDSVVPHHTRAGLDISHNDVSVHHEERTEQAGYRSPVRSRTQERLEPERYKLVGSDIIPDIEMGAIDNGLTDSSRILPIGGDARVDTGNNQVDVSKSVIVNRQEGRTAEDRTAALERDARIPADVLENLGGSHETERDSRRMDDLAVHGLQPSEWRTREDAAGTQVTESDLVDDRTSGQCPREILASENIPMRMRYFGTSRRLGVPRGHGTARRINDTRGRGVARGRGGTRGRGVARGRGSSITLGATRVPVSTQQNSTLDRPDTSVGESQRRDIPGCGIPRTQVQVVSLSNGIGTEVRMAQGEQLQLTNERTHQENAPIGRELRERNRRDVRYNLSQQTTENGYHERESNIMSMVLQDHRDSSGRTLRSAPDQIGNENAHPSTNINNTSHRVQEPILSARPSTRMKRRVRGRLR